MPIVGGDPDRLRALAREMDRVVDEHDARLRPLYRAVERDGLVLPAAVWRALALPTVLRPVAADLRARADALERPPGPDLDTHCARTLFGRLAGMLSVAGLGEAVVLFAGGDAEAASEVLHQTVFAGEVGNQLFNAAGAVAERISGSAARGVAVAGSGLVVSLVATGFDLFGRGGCPVPVFPVNQQHLDGIGEDEWVYGENDVENNAGFVNCGNDCRGPGFSR